MPLVTEVKVVRKQVLATNTALFELAPGPCNRLPTFTAGAHIDVWTPAGHVRQYSLCGPLSSQGTYQVAVRREMNGRGGSVSMYEGVSEGDVLQISEPKNHFPLNEDTAFSVLFAAGIGITPIVVMAERLHDLGKRFVLHYCSREPADAAFMDRLANSAYVDQVKFHFTHGDSRRRLNMLGVLEQEVAHPLDVYACGPGPFIQAAKAAAMAVGIPDERFHSEHFGAVSHPAGTDQGFEVYLDRSQRSVWVPADQAITQVLKASGVAVETSCEQGVCGACLTTVLAGTVDHRDLYLTPAEQAAGTCMLPCCSRAKSDRLVLDL